MDRLRKFLTYLIFVLSGLYLFNQCDLFEEVSPDVKIIYHDEYGKVKYADSPPEYRQFKKASAFHPDAPIRGLPQSVVAECDSFVSIETPFFIGIGSAAGNVYNTHNIDPSYIYLTFGSLTYDVVVDSVFFGFIGLIETAVTQYYAAVGASYSEVEVFDKSEFDIPNGVLIPDFFVIVKESSLTRDDLPNMILRFPGIKLYMYKGDRTVHNTMIGTQNLAPIFSEYTSLNVFSLWGGIDSVFAGDAVQVFIDTCKGDIRFSILNGVSLSSEQYIYLDSISQVLID